LPSTERGYPMHRIRSVLLLTSFSFVMLLLWSVTHAPPAHAADAVVGDGSAASCTQSAFVSALTTVQGSGGGTITFDCGGTATIPLSNYLSISTTISIDGANDITFTGNNNAAFFQIFVDANLTLRDLTLTQGRFSGAHPLENFGILMLDGVTVTDSGVVGSAVANYGTLNIADSTFTNNRLDGSNDTNGGAITNDGGDLLITNSTFSNNVVAGVLGTGGAIAITSGAVTISDSTFTANEATDGGAFYVSSTSALTVTDSTFNDNEASYGGAMVTSGSQVTLSNSVFTNNRAMVGQGGAIWVTGGTLNATRVEFEGNQSATNGGAVNCASGFVSIVESAVVTNQAGLQGGGVYSTCNLTLTNVTISGNQATQAGGGVYQTDTGKAMITYATIAYNTAVNFGGGIYNDSSGTNLMTISKSIVAFNSRGNCDGIMLSMGYNFTNDTGCSAFVLSNDEIEANLPLAPLGNYGGFTVTHPLAEGNAALNYITAGDCQVATDQRGVARPQEGDCDSGAVEGAPLVFSRVFMPLVQR
jgi:predicted outer membrane repeat protein